ncbi:MAG TPA: hypothetical protein VMT87_05605 [Vicinamibacteria bacterium]|nr:hypothetical protein [Vicinamibacteria bacterium]
MTRERAKTFADRLPPVLAGDEEDISQLPDEMVDILYPGRRVRPFRMGVTFAAFDGPDYARALDLARRSPQYSQTTTRTTTVHHAAFETTAARTLHRLFQIVGGRPGTEVLVDGRKAPYAADLWLPLFWIFMGEGE